MVGGLPKDEHSHDRRFAGSGGHFMGQSVDSVVVFEVNSFKFAGDVRGTGFPQIDMGEDRVDLGKIERKFLSAGPVVDKVPGCGCDAWVSRLLPICDSLANEVDQLELFPGDTDVSELGGGSSGSSGTCHRGHILRCASSGGYRGKSLGIAVKWPVVLRRIKRGIDDGLFFRTDGFQQNPWGYQGHGGLTPEGDFACILAHGGPSLH